MSDTSFQRLQTAKFSIRSPRVRVAKRIQQELIRASERRRRRRRPGRKAISQLYLREAVSDASSSGRTVQEAHKYLPQCDQAMQNAVDLYITSEFKKKNIQIINQSDLREYKQLVIAAIERFLTEPVSTQKQYLQAAVLSPPNQTREPCSSPFQLFFDLHKQHTKIDRQLASSRGRDIDIGSLAVNLDRAETGEEPDPTRLQMITWDRFVTQARAIWHGMSPDQKLPFFVQAYFAMHFPESFDQALH